MKTKYDSIAEWDFVNSRRIRESSGIRTNGNQAPVTFFFLVDQLLTTPLAFDMQMPPLTKGIRSTP